MSDIKKGDRVRVAFEGTVVWVNRLEDGYDISVDDSGRTDVSTFRGAQQLIEKIEPPVEVFKPGDVLRIKGDETEPWDVVLAKTGYVQRFCNGKASFYEYADGAEREGFNSEHYEKINLA